MKKMLGLALLASTAAIGVASAEEGSFSGNVALTTDYVFRGLSQSSEDPAVQGGFDYTNGIFYAGAWGSSLGGGAVSSEMDLYAGLKPVTGPVTWDLGLIGYFYPGANDDAQELDYQEIKAAASIAPTEGLTLGAAVFYSPDFYGELDSGLYYEINAGFTINDMFSISGAVGNQSVDDVDGPGPGTVEDDYTTWNVGGTLSYAGFGFDLRYVEADVDAGDPITTFLTTEAFADGRTVLTIKRAL